MEDFSTLIYALIGGILPALFWLWFWLKEDSAHPEPRSRIAISFLAGMVAVVIAFYLERAACGIFSFNNCEAFTDNETLAILLAFIEEGVKFLIVFIIAFHSRYFDEPVDAIIYLITVALGFAALENTKYILDTITDQGITLGIINGNLRFIGATILHVASSAVVGIAIAIPFYRHMAERVAWAIFGIVIATLLHALFNLSIIKAVTIGQSLQVFSYTWITIVVIMLLFEKIKHIKPSNDKAKVFF